MNYIWDYWSHLFSGESFSQASDSADLGELGQIKADTTANMMNAGATQAEIDAAMADVDYAWGSADHASVITVFGRNTMNDLANALGAGSLGTYVLIIAVVLVVVVLVSLFRS